MVGNRAVYEIMGGNIVERGRLQMPYGACALVIYLSVCVFNVR